MATEDFVSVTGDDWYQRRRKDAEGEFFLKIAEQGHRKGAGTNTRQGIYAFTADGEVLWAKNTGQDPHYTKTELKHALAQFQRLPAARRTPGAVTVPTHGPLDPNYTRTPPVGGLILKVNTRILDKKDSNYTKGSCDRVGGAMSARDYLWLTKPEMQSLAPPSTEEGFTYDVSKKIAQRIARFHLVDNTRGEPLPWDAKDVRKCRMTLTATGGNAEFIELRLDGEALMASDADPAKAVNGYEVRLLGKLRYVLAKQTFDQFEVVAVGDHWGDGPFTQGARPGRNPLGVSFGLVTGDNPADRVPPQAARNQDDYFDKASK